MIINQYGYDPRRPGHGTKRCSRDGLARFRADPVKVKVSIRRIMRRKWRVTIALRDRFLAATFPAVKVVWTSPARALVIALRRAEANQMPGIDIDMDWAYEHPQWKGKKQ